MLHIRTSGITIYDFHNDYVYQCVNFWYDKIKRCQTKTKENAKMQRKPSEAEKSPTFDICMLSAQIDELLRLTFLLCKVDLKLPNVKCLFFVCL